MIFNSFRAIIIFYLANNDLQLPPLIYVSCDCETGHSRSQDYDNRCSCEFLYWKPEATYFLPEISNWLHGNQCWECLWKRKLNGRGIYTATLMRANHLGCHSLKSKWSLSFVNLWSALSWKMCRKEIVSWILLSSIMWLEHGGLNGRYPCPRGIKIVSVNPIIEFRMGVNYIPRPLTQEGVCENRTALWHLGGGRTQIYLFFIAGVTQIIFDTLVLIIEL